MVTAKALAAAILLCQPSMSSGNARHYAAVIIEESSRHHFDAMTAVALICHESHWNPVAVSADGEDHGLGQVRARYFGACRSDTEPIRSPNPSCRATKAALLDPIYNIRVVAEQIERWKRTCRTKTGRRALDHRWLAGYGGFSNPSKGKWCGQQRKLGRWVDLPRPLQVETILRYRRLLASGQCPLNRRTNRFR
jgi:hypothetical protein